MIPISLCQEKRPGAEVGNPGQLLLDPLQINILQEGLNLGGGSGGGWTRLTGLHSRSEVGPHDMEISLTHLEGSAEHNG